MVIFFKTSVQNIIAVQADHSFSADETKKLSWLFDNAELLPDSTLKGWFIGPRKEMITPWSTNAVEITQNMGLTGISRIEEFFPVTDGSAEFDKMLQRLYNGIDGKIFDIDKQPDPIVYIDDLAAYNEQEGLALSPDEINYLNDLSKKIGRKLTDSEVFGFSQVNSEHCRHKIFNGVFIIDGQEKDSSLFKLIKKTSEYNPNRLVSAYKDNVAFNAGPTVEQFAPINPQQPDFFEIKDIKTVISLKSRDNTISPTTVEPLQRSCHRYGR